MFIRLSALLIPAALFLLSIGHARKQAAAEEQPKDPLPPGAVLRLGSVREWHGAVRVVAIAPDGKMLAAAGDDKIIRLWDLTTGKEIRQLRGHVRPILALAFSPNGKLLASGGEAMNGQPIRMWNVERGTEIRQLGAWEEEVRSLAFSRDGKTLVVGQDQCLWDVASGQERQWNGFPDLGGQVSSAAISPDGKSLALASFAGRVFHTDLGTGKSTRLPAKPTNCGFVTFTPDGQHIASGGGDYLRLWDLATEKQTLPFGETSVDRFSFSPDGKTVAWIDRGTDVYYGELATGKQARPFVGHQSAVTCLCFSPDGRTIASSSRDGTVLLWDATGWKRDGKPLAFTLSAREARQAARQDRVPRALDDARASIHFDRAEYLLGENILVHFCVENAGKGLVPVTFGGDYRGASRPLSFSIQATDADGNAVPDPRPSQMSFGGLTSTTELAPGQQHWTSLALTRYCRFDKPGVYRVQVAHGLGSAAATIKLVTPTEEQARQLVEAAYQLPADQVGVEGQKQKPFTDFSTFHYSVYWPLFRHRAAAGCPKALQALGVIPTPEATESLIGLISHSDAKFGLDAVRTLNLRLPDPQLDGKLPGRSFFEDPQIEPRRWLVSQAWRPELAPQVRGIARRLLLKPDRESQELGAFILECVGQKEDMPDLIKTVDWAVCQTRKLPAEENVYPRPRGACRELLRAVRMLNERGAAVPEHPENPGEAIVFLDAIGHRTEFRPRDWEKTYAEQLRHEIAYVREQALNCLPSPAPKSLLAQVAVLLRDADVDVQIAACHVAGKSKAAELKEPLIQVLRTAREDWLLNAAHNAARELEVGYQEIEIWVSRLDEEGMAAPALYRLSGLVVSDYRGMSYPTRTMLDVEAGKACKARWARFLQEHGQALKTGKRFKVSDPALTADLFPLFTFSP